MIFLTIYTVLLSIFGYLLYYFSKKYEENSTVFLGFVIIITIISFFIFGIGIIKENRIDISDECKIYPLNKGALVEYEGEYYPVRSISARKYYNKNPKVILIDKYTLFYNTLNKDEVLIKKRKKKKVTKKKVNKKQNIEKYKGKNIIPL